ncbi:hypothetical protein [Legionella spiritensis]|uniref:Uncharacterized protein n=1 Tax=Legionella spiritensis TaxID=452 RepID=A0A0W0YZJ1_LEGSP|nr:hypothetical protein [Legionella spiritensis]KTD62274.1 hypothetical protein Lspi_2124 [Legionella spiritensis]SNV28572.1 Uncharacterised protein [Legionella spiritensis]
MGWGESWGAVTDWVSTTWNNASVQKVMQGAGTYCFNTVEYIFKQVGVLPATLKSMAFDPPTREVVKHIVYLAGDYALYALIPYVSDMVEEAARSSFSDDNPALLSVDTALTVGIGALSLATMAFKTRQTLKMGGRAAVIAMEGAKAFNNAITSSDKEESKDKEIIPRAEKSGKHPKKDKKKTALCQIEGCTTGKFVKSSARSQLGFWSIEGILWMLGKLPYTERVVFVFYLLHRGRYVTNMILPELCPAHQHAYLREHPEIPAAFGLTHAGLSALANYLIESNTGIPSKYYGAGIDQIMLMIQMSLAAHMKNDLPKPVAASSRLPVDPLMIYLNSLYWTVDTFGVGLKARLPEMLKGKSIVPWGLLATVGNKAWDNSASRLLRSILLPELLQDPDKLASDPVIGSHVVEVRDVVADTINTVDKVRHKYVVRAAQQTPAASAKALQALFGAPPEATRVFLKLLGNTGFMDSLSQLRRRLQEQTLGVKTEVEVDEKDTTPDLRVGKAPHESPKIKRTHPSEKGISSITVSEVVVPAKRTGRGLTLFDDSDTTQAVCKVIRSRSGNSHGFFADSSPKQISSNEVITRSKDPKGFQSSGFNQ